jgi:hypothetical protein
MTRRPHLPKPNLSASVGKRHDFDLNRVGISNRVEIYSCVDIR